MCDLFQKSKKCVEFPQNMPNKIKDDWHKVLETIDEHYWGIWNVCETDEEREMLMNTIGKLVTNLREDYVNKGMVETLRCALDKRKHKHNNKQK